MPQNHPNRWSQHVTETSNALDLEPGVFSWDDPRKIALSLKRSADNSRRRKAAPFVSAMSMLNFYINRAGKHLSAQQRGVLEKAKDELRELYGKPGIEAEQKFFNDK
ncbi:DUF3175 domain-containing protein [Nitrosomonas supralitoralis]|uniref:DUF3175 domain-containing protein n=1 Tax=Nitrosomonas supralitoralis TaxID=2116706 RepID=A0A2P7NX56_9PROT|nr:DUF3175 domain-containing protein [Nitrosomonas supralitoralis]PSJ18052.1 hypothetical protein C7H79_05045 [Nitrosomonas supralitoralis]